MERHSTRYPAMVLDQRHFNIDCHFTPASGPGVGCVVPSLLSNRKEAAVSVFDRYLSLWVALGIIGGVALGNWFPGLFQIVAAWEYASVNLVVATLIWAWSTQFALVDDLVGDGVAIE